jgi:hypothetical protein
MISGQKTFITAIAFVAFSASSAMCAEWERTYGIFAQIKMISTTAGTKVFSYTNYSTVASDLEGDTVSTCAGGGEVTDAGTTLKLACEYIDIDGDKFYELVERTVGEGCAKGKGRLTSAGGTGKHANRNYECIYSFIYMPKLEGMSDIPLTVRTKCRGDLPS